MPNATPILQRFRLKRFCLSVTAIVALLIAAFLLLNSYTSNLLPSTSFTAATWSVALLSIVALTSDVVLPVPASIILVANGAVFGIVLGSVMSVVGLMGSFTTAFALGRIAHPYVLRVVTAAEQSEAERMLSRWGTWAIALSRPVPVLAETVAFFAGSSRLPWRRSLLSAALGIIPSGVFHAMVGAGAGQLITG
jgi:uncharacterized membrane protein YdjX (TVP38/TMEM64 family)